MGNNNIQQKQNIGIWLKKSDAPTYGLYKDFTIPTNYYYCSNCKQVISDRYGLYPYCPYCGSSMFTPGEIEEYQTRVKELAEQKKISEEQNRVFSMLP